MKAVFADDSNKSGRCFQHSGHSGREHSTCLKGMKSTPSCSSEITPPCTALHRAWIQNLKQSCQLRQRPALGPARLTPLPNDRLPPGQLRPTPGQARKLVQDRETGLKRAVRAAGQLKALLRCEWAKQQARSSRWAQARAEEFHQISVQVQSRLDTGSVGHDSELWKRSA